MLCRRAFNSFFLIIGANSIRASAIFFKHVSFEISPVGKARLKIVDAESFKVVKYQGDGLNNTNFFLWVQLKDISESITGAKITLKADLNPALKMLASKPLNDFLEKLISGMESFKDWNSND